MKKDRFATARANRLKAFQWAMDQPDADIVLRRYGFNWFMSEWAPWWEANCDRRL